MPIQIEFRGVMLFHPSDDTVPEVLIPHAGRGATPNGSGSGGQHADGTDARRHFAGILVLRATGAVEHHEPDPGEDRARLGVVTVAESAADGCRKGSFANMVGLGRVVNTPVPDEQLELVANDDSMAFWRRAAAVVRLNSGTIRATGPSDFFWRFDRDYNPGHGYARERFALGATWTSRTDAVTLDVDDRVGRTRTVLQLTAGDRAYVYNVDASRPDESQLEKTETCTGAVVDHDFKWLYQLLTPRRAGLSFDGWRRGRPLAAPITSCERAPAATDQTPKAATQAPVLNFAPEVSTCFPACWPDC
jgi:hypothetical protein